MMTSWPSGSYGQRRKAEWAFVDDCISALRKIVDTAQAHPAKANFVAVHRQLIGEARALVDSVSECSPCPTRLNAAVSMSSNVPAASAALP
jgi:hypothetical protein